MKDQASTFPLKSVNPVEMFANNLNELQELQDIDIKGTFETFIKEIDGFKIYRKKLLNEIKEKEIKENKYLSDAQKKYKHKSHKNDEHRIKFNQKINSDLSLKIQCH